MSGFLLDAHVVSMLAPSKSAASADFLTWLDRMDADGRLFLSVVTIHEIEKGIALLNHRQATAKAASLKAWLNGLVATYDDKIIGFDAQAAAIGGRLEATALAAGHDPGMADAVIAGTPRRMNSSSLPAARRISCHSASPCCRLTRLPHTGPPFDLCRRRLTVGRTSTSTRRAAVHG